jgi:alkanesulfonate monooxygenase SsuD/methylene tetrahydromethanopterin reductase-like flavin-dependent oxidoreductase (luciferase family)
MTDSLLVRVGLVLPTFREKPDDALAIAVEAENVGIDGVFCFDHLWPMGQPNRPAMAPFPLLGAIAARSRSICLGTLVARVGLVPEGILADEFYALHQIAPGRVIAGIGSGDRLSAPENLAYGLPYESADRRRLAIERCGAALVQQGIPVWVGGGSPATVALAERIGAAVNLWEADPSDVAVQARQTKVTWGGVARVDGNLAVDDQVSELVALGRPLAQAGASWVVFAGSLHPAAVAATAVALRGETASST